MTALDDLRERIAAGANPFELRFAKDAWDDSALAGDVPAIHREASEALTRLLDAVARDGRTRAALVYGEAGSGKTHVTARLRRAASGRGLFVAVTTGSEPLRAMTEAAAIDLRRTPPRAPRAQLALLVDRLVERLGPELLASDFQALAEYLTPDELDERPALATRVLERRLAPAFAYRVPECPTDVARALFLERVGVPALEDAFGRCDPVRVLRGLGALSAAAGVPFVIALDQNDAVDPRELARAVTRLHAASGFAIVVTFLTALWDTKRDALLEPERQRIEENRIPLKAPTLSEIQAFVEARLQDVHASLGAVPSSRLAPFAPRDLEEIARRGSQLTLRDWCRYLATLLDERLRAVERAPKPDGLELRLRALEAEVRADLPEGEVALREALALALRGAGEVSGPLDPDGPLDLVVQVAAERVGMKVVDSERAPVLARRIEQILDELDAQQVTRAVVVRTRAVAPSWRRCRELMDELRGRGGEVVVVTDDERATLHALARLDARAVARLAHELPIIRRLTERPSAVTA